MRLGQHVGSRKTETGALSADDDRPLWSGSSLARPRSIRTYVYSVALTCCAYPRRELTLTDRSLVVRDRQIELIPGGSRRAVTSANRLEYVNRVAKYHLVDSLKVRAYLEPCDGCSSCGS